MPALFMLCILVFLKPIALEAISEREVLVDFYHSTSGPDWIRQDNWLSADIPYCQWHGVLCNDHGQVEEIQLYDNELNGPLPQTLCDLAELKTLYLSFNGISGSLATSLGECSKLENLWLKANKLQGKRDV